MADDYIQQEEFSAKDYDRPARRIKQLLEMGMNLAVSHQKFNTVTISYSSKQYTDLVVANLPGPEVTIR